MPQIIMKGGDTKGGDKKDSKKGLSPLSSLSEPMDREKMLLIGAGVLAVLGLVVALFVFTRPNAPAVEKVPPPPGLPDVYPYNSKEYQKRGMPAISGVPPPALVKQWEQKK